MQDGSFRQEPGSGVCGRVQGATVAVGNLDWVRSHSQPANLASTSSTGTPHSSGNTPTRYHSQAEQDRSDDHTHNSPSSSSSSSSSSGSSGIGRAGLDSAGRGEEASTSGRGPEGGQGGLMTVYVGVDGRLAGMFEIRDELRPDAAATVKGLQLQGIDTILLSGTRGHSGCQCVPF